LAVRANLIVGAIGAVLALVSGSVIAVNWESLVGLETWEARFTASATVLPERAANLGPGTTRNEVYEITAANVTRINLDLTWTNPAFNSPELTVRLLDPAKNVRAQQSHTGGSTGIHIEALLIADADVPAGVTTYRVRSDPQDLNARQAFETRWPTNDDAIGTWTVEIQSTAPENPAPGGSVFYTLRAEYQHYSGTFAKVPEAVK
jgi:hypothetical protein